MFKKKLIALALLSASCALATAGCQSHQTIVIGNTLADNRSPLTLTGPVVLRVERNDQVVSFLVRPSPGAQAGSARLHNSEPVLEIGDSTSAYAAGTRPVVRGVRTVAGATGTQFGLRSVGGVELIYVHRPTSGIGNNDTVRFSRRDGDTTQGKVFQLRAGQGAKYFPTTDTIEVFDSATALNIPADLKSLIDETKAAFAAAGSP